MEVMIVKEETLVAGGMKEEDTYLMKTAKVKMDHVREENERLKLTLSRMMKNYHSLKMQFNDIVKEDDCDQPKIKSSTDDIEESDPFVSLSLGRFSGDHSSKRDEKIKADYSNESKTHENDRKLDGLELGLDCKFHAAGNPAHDHHQVSRNLMGSPENNYSSDESKEEGNDEKRGSRKSPKISRSGDDEVLQLQNPLKKPRVSVRAVCNTQTMHDGCQWRKYGQKISKGNPCPRAYYRCTVSPSCPVRKQVQRCMDDMTILITTYEGAHNHPLPPAATTMASATTAAASMLNFGSTTSPPGSGVSATCSSTTSRGFNFASSNNMFPRATISTSQSHPTVILDLTPPNHSNNNSNASAQNNKLFSSSTLFSTPTNSLNFSSSSNWNTNFSNFKNSQPFNYNNLSQLEIIANEYDHKFSAATKAITRDPSFQSALAAAITSFVGNNVQGRNSNSGLNFDLSFTQPSTSNGSIACATSLLNKFPQISVDYQHKDMAHFAPLTLMSSSKSKAMVSMADEAEQIKLL